MKNEKKITKNNVMQELRNLLRKNIVGMSRVCEEGKMEFYFPNGQTFKIVVEEVE